MSLEPQSDPSDRPLTPSRRRANGPLLRSQSRQEEIRLACLKGDLTLLETLIKGNTENINELFQDGWSLLMMAGNGANPSIVKFLLGMGADPNKCRADGFSPLMAALTSSRGRVHVLVQQCVQLLIDAGADVSARSEDGLTPLGLAVKDNRVPVVDLLVFQGADLNAKDGNGKTASQLAQERGLSQILLTLDKTEHEQSNDTRKALKMENVNLGSESEISLNKHHDTTTAKALTSPETPSVTDLKVSSQIMDDNTDPKPDVMGNTSLKAPPPLSPEQKEMDESLDMVKKNNVLAAIAEGNNMPATLPLELDSVTASSSLPHQSNQEIPENRKSLQCDEKQQEKSSPTNYSSSPSSVGNDLPTDAASSQRGNDALVLKIGLALGLFASLVGAYYAKVYLQKQV